jgi:hypothetical protein
MYHTCFDFFPLVYPGILVVYCISYEMKFFIAYCDNLPREFIKTL